MVTSSGTHEGKAPSLASGRTADGTSAPSEILERAMNALPWDGRALTRRRPSVGHPSIGPDLDGDGDDVVAETGLAGCAGLGSGQMF